MLRRLRRTIWGHTPDIEVLSERLDGRLTSDQARLTDEHVASCKVCAAAMDELRGTRLLLSATPEVDAPRSFRLRAADVADRVPARTHGGFGLMRWSPALSGAAVAVLVVTIGINYVSSGGGSGSSSGRDASAPTGMLAADRAAATTELAPAAGAAVTSPDAADTATESQAPAEETSTGEFSQTAPATGDLAPPTTETQVAEAGVGAAVPEAPSLTPTPDAAISAPDSVDDDPGTAAASGLAENDGSGGSEAFAPPAPSNTESIGVVPGGSDDEDGGAMEKAADGEDDGNLDGFLIVEVTAALVAAAAAAGYLAWRITGGGEAK